jgi:flagellar protein FlbD
MDRLVGVPQADMILLTRLNRAPLLLNSDLIDHIEASPDTVVSLLNGQKLLVLETPEEIVERVIQFRRSVMAKPFPISRKALPEDGDQLSEFVRGGHLPHPETQKEDG